MDKLERNKMEEKKQIEESALSTIDPWIEYHIFRSVTMTWIGEIITLHIQDNGNWKKLMEEK
jgi:hypothetical protein